MIRRMGISLHKSNRALALKRQAVTKTPGEALPCPTSTRLCLTAFPTQLANRRSVVSLQFRKLELLKVMCAAIRLNPQKAFAQPDNKFSPDGLRELVPSDRRLVAESATDFNVFWWGGVTDGFLPDGLADNLARLDALEAEVSDDESDRASTRPTFLFHNRTPSNTVRPASCLPTSRPIRLIMIII
ncbi:uncharacterized protein UTRI_10263 [Ustilago trichophora]|uniref:Uncharacterized protein n=1 Tax=Ustilago trichophora TaxID=86804 RepID=A0A5C3EQC0_9BASI|nr:uncharacterized protein UTRI_10263 [Ustilago trichophora]